METEESLQILGCRASQDTADRVNETLPVKITTEDVEKTPEFVNMLKILSAHLTEDGISKSLKKEHQQAHKNLQHEKHRWLQQHILHKELTELLLDNQLEEDDSNISSRQFYNAVQDCFLLAEIGDYLVTNPNLDTTLLGLKKEDLQRRNPHRKHIPAIQQKLIPEIENRLRKKCENLVSFHDSANPSSSESSKATFAKAAQLPAVLESEKQELLEEQKQLKRDKLAREKQFWQYYQTLVASLEVLEKLILNHRLKSQNECDKTTSNWLTARCDAMCLKIKLLELQLMCDTYYADTVSALKIIRTEVDAAISKTKDEISTVSEALNSYESVGAGFEALVREYTYLKEEIDNKKWAIQELKPAITTSDTAS